MQSLMNNFKRDTRFFLLLFRAYLKQNLVRLTTNIKHYHIYMKHSNNEVLENVISSDRRLFFLVDTQLFLCGNIMSYYVLMQDNLDSY